jgi:hypothetical protein
VNLARDNPLAQGLEMTRQMLELVKAGEWEAVAELGAKRLQLLHQLNLGADASNAQLYLGVLQEIQSLDQEIESLSRERKDEAADQLRRIYQGRKVDKAYRR